MLSADFTFKKAMDAAITQGMAQKDVRDVRETSQGEKSSSNVNKVKHDNGSSHSRLSGRHTAVVENNLSRLEIKRSDVFAVVLPTIPQTTANTKIQSVSSVI